MQKAVTKMSQKGWNLGFTVRDDQLSGCEEVGGAPDWVRRECPGFIRVLKVLGRCRSTPRL